MKPKYKKLLSMLLTAAMVLNMGLPPVFAAEGTTRPGVSGVCTHHTDHTEECGYLQGTPCNHAHTEDCYTKELTCTLIEDDTAEMAADSEATLDNGTAHAHGEDCYTKTDNCKHEHSADCGQTPDSPCTFDVASCIQCNTGDKKPEQVCTCPPVDSGEQIHGKDCPLYIAPEWSEAIKSYKAISPEDSSVFEATGQYQKLMALHTALSGAAPMANEATWNISTGDLTLTSTCGIPCYGHEVSGSTTTHTITVSGGSHNVTLNGVSIDVSGTSNAAFAITGGGSVNLTLTGANTLKSGSYKAGLQVTSGNTLTVTAASSGSLTAIGGNSGAGIGGSSSGSGGSINISGGTVNAAGGNSSAGIGGGHSGAGGQISISGGTVNATGGKYGAGVGGGSNSSGGNINISGGTVTATGGNVSAGIGGGSSGAGGTITISDHAVVFATKGESAPTHIGEGSYGIPGTVNRNGGIIFESKNGLLYAANVTPTASFTIPTTYTLTIASGKTLTINTGITVTNNGTILNIGSIIGTVTGNQPIAPNPATHDIGTGNLTLDSTCGGGTCQGHTVTGNTAAYKIIVESGAHNVTLNGVSINASGTSDAAFAITGGGSVNLTLTGANTLKSGETKAGLEVTAGNTLTVTAASSGSLTAIGGVGGAGVGGGYKGAGGKISIKGGTINATGGGGAGIGGGANGAGGEISINGDAVVYARKAENAPNHIGPGSYFSDGTVAKTCGIIFEGESGAVYGSVTLVQDLTITSSQALLVNAGTDLTIPSGITLQNNGAIYQWGPINGTVSGNEVVKMRGGEHPIYTGDLTLTGGCTGGCSGHTVVGETNTYKIVVEGGSHNVTLKNAAIDVSGTERACAFAITGGSVNLTLEGASVLKSGGLRAGLEVQAGSALTVTSGSTGSLTATGGDSSATGGDSSATGGDSSAGVGCGFKGAGGNITIGGGTVNATGGKYGAGIGGGEISIGGGTVNATGGQNGAGIGGGEISINGGTVNATGGKYGAGIGGGYKGAGGNITIGGGTINATGGKYGAGIGGGYLGPGGEISINGDTAVYAQKGENAPNHIGPGSYVSDETVAKTRGIIFEGASGTVYGSVTLESDLTIAPQQTLTIGSGAALTNNGTLLLSGKLTGAGTLSGTGTFKASILPGDIATIADQVYTGAAITPKVTFTPRTIMGKEFAIDTTGYTQKYEDNINVGTAKVIFTKDSDSNVKNEQSFTITQSDTAFTDGIKTYKDTTEQSSFVYGDIIKVKVTPTATGSKSRMAALGSNQVALFLDSIQLTDPQNVTNGVDVTFTIDTKAKALQIGSNEITAQYVGNGNMAGHSESVTVTLNQKLLTATISAGSSKPYDGTVNFTGAVLTIGNSQILSGDTVSPSATIEADTASVGSKTPVVRNLALTGASKDWYSLAASGVTGNLTITAATPSVEVVAEKKEPSFFRSIIGSHEDTITLTATVTGVNGEKPSGSVVFKNGGTALATKSVSNGVAAFDWATPTAGDSITITAEFTASDSNYISTAVTDTYEFGISKAEQAALTIAGVPSTVTYGDVTFTLSATGGSGTGSLSYAVTAGDAVSVNAATGQVTILKAGKAAITATKALDDNYNAKSAEVGIEVKAAIPTVSWGANTMQTVTYTGTTAVITSPTVSGIAVGDTSSGTITYQYKSTAAKLTNLFGLLEGYTDGLPTNAGEYKIIATVAANGNYAEAKSSEMTLTIEKSRTSVTINSFVDTSYTGKAVANPTEADMSITDAAYADVKFTYYADNGGAKGNQIDTPKNAGTYHVEASIVETTNTAASISTPVKFSINPTQLTVTGGTVTQREYDGTTAATVTLLTFDGLKNGETLAITTDYKAGTPVYDSADAGTNKTVSGTAGLESNAKTSNYTLTGAYSITNQTISKKTGIAAPSYAAMDNTGTTKSFTFGTVSGCTNVTDYEWKLHTDADTAWTAVTSNPITFGNRSGKMQVRVKGTTNYEAGAILTHSTAFTAILEGSVSIEGTATYGETLTAIPTDTQTGAVLSYEWKSGDAVLQPKSTNDTCKIAGTAVGKAITVEVTAASYTGSLTASTTTVAKKAVTAMPATISKVYNGTNAVETADQILTIAKVNNGDDITITMPSAAYNDANAGTGKAVTVGDLTITGAAKDWYTVTAPGSVTGEITAKPLANSMISGINPSYSYTGSAISPNPTVTDGDPSIIAASDYTVSCEANTNAGTAKVILTGKKNYSGTAEKTFTISRATGSITITGHPAKTYDGTAVSEPAVNKNGSDGAVSFEWYEGSTKLAGAPKDAGSYTVQAIMEQGTNHTTATTAKSFTVAKAAAPSITYPTAAGLNYGAKLCTSALTDGSTAYGSFAWEDGNIVPTVANSGYSVKFTPSESTLKNYEAITPLAQTVNVAVAKTTPAIHLKAQVSGDIGNRQAILTATLKNVGDGEIPTGTVKFVNTTGSPADIETVSIKNGVAAYTWTGLADQAYKVNAEYSGSGNYDTVTATKISFDTRKQKQQNFAIAAIGTKTYGDGVFTLTTRGGSGSGAVGFTSSDPTTVSISGNTATIHKAGNVTITANKAEDDSYNEAAATASLTVNKKAISFIANDMPNVVKGSQMPNFTYKPVTLAAGDSIITEPTLATTAADTNTLGKFAITISGAMVSNANSYTITYVNGEMNVVEQLYSVAVPDGTVSDGGGGVTPAPKPAPSTTPRTTPTTAESNVNSKTDKDGNATAAVADKDITNAIGKAQKEAKKKGTKANGIAIILNVKTDKNTAALGVTLSKKSVSALIAANVASVTVKNGLSTVTLDLATLKALAGGDVILTVSKADTTKLSKEAQAAIGSRPVFRFGLTSGGKTVSDFKGGRAGLQIPYLLATTEQVGNLCGVYVDVSGKVNWLEASSYDPITGMMLISAQHFSTYGIGYKTNTPKFTDAGTHWAKNDIDFVVARGLLTGTSKTTFAPETSMTRGMFVTALGRLAGVDTKKYKSTKFTDVAATACYSPYVAWAGANNIVSGTSDTTFSPDKAITRQEMAVMLVNYSKAIRYKLPSVHAEVTFADAGSIPSGAKQAVKQMQMAGILIGKSGNRFDSTASATRAEVSAMLRRYVELMVNTETAEGWAMNESGQWLYIENGKRVTGSKTIGGKSYTFDQYGVTTALPPYCKYLTHIVQKGESFWSIPLKYKVSIFELAKVNGFCKCSKLSSCWGCGTK